MVRMNTDFHLALDKMIEALVENDIDPNTVRKIIQFSEYVVNHNGNIFEDAYFKLRENLLKQ